MTNEEYRTKLNEIKGQIADLPDADRDRINDMVAQANTRRERAQRASTELGEAISGLRTTAKYLAFDLEATRREKFQLQARLDAKTD